jgi:hypothetical protein
MFGKKQGQWIDFSQRDSTLKTVRIATSCTSTSAESAGHFTTVRAGGKITAVNDELTESPQTVQAGVEHDQV